MATAMLLAGASMLLYPGGTAFDASSRGYSFAHNFLSDLGSTVSLSGERNTASAVLFGGGVLIMVLVLGGTMVAVVRLLSAVPRARPFARLAAAAGVFVCLGFVGVALAPEDRAFGLHMASGIVAFRSFPVAAALLAIAVMRDDRFRARAAVGWVTLAAVIAGFITMTHLGPSVETEYGCMVQAITQKVMAATVLVVLWLESHEAEVASARA